MTVKESQLKAAKKYNDKLEEVKIRVPMGYRNIIKEYAKTKGESVNELVLRLLCEEIKELPQNR